MKPGNNTAIPILRPIAAQILAVLTTLSTVFAAPSPPDSGTVRGMLLHEAYYHFFLSDYLESATRLKLIDSTSPEKTDLGTQNDVQSLLGSLYFTWRMDRTARKVFSELVSGQPEGYDRDRLLYRVERLEYGRKLYGEATETYGVLSPDTQIPEADHARYMAGMSLRETGSPDRSVEVLKTVSPSSPYYPFSRFAIAQGETELENIPEAILELQGLAEAKTGKDPVLASFRAKSLLTLGMLYLENGQFDAAAETLSRLPESSEFRPEVLYGRGWARFNSGRIREALLDFEDLIRTAPEHPYADEALTIRANCYARLKANRAALTSYGMAVDAYGQKVRSYREARAWLEEPGRLEQWLASPEENPAPPLEPFLADETLRFRVGQYRELIGFEDYFNRKLGDMEVFDVMLKHRESVYRSRLPDVGKFLDGKSVERLKGKGEALQADFMNSVQAESGVLGLLMKDEKESLASINGARARVARLKKAIKTLAVGASDRLEEESARLSAIDRWLSIFSGEILWVSITTLPGRSNDIDNHIASLTGNIEELVERKDRLIRSISLMRETLAGYGGTIPLLAERLKQERDRTVELRKNLLSPLKDLFVRKIDGRLEYYNQLASYARFGQIQVMDIEKQ